MTDVFVSYKAEDRPRVAPLVEALEADGLSVWWDAHIGAGDEWRDTILRHLEGARAVIVVWSRRSVGPHGQFVRDEATRALRRRAYVPVRIDKVDAPLGFGETQALDLHGWKGERSDPRYLAVLATLRQRLGIKAKPARRPEGQQRGISRRAMIGTGAAAVAAAAGAGAWFYFRPEPEGASSIAVLPFANLSGDPTQAYFSDGLAEELRGALSRVAGLKVVARTSSEAVRDEDAKTAAERLRVNNILTGSVRRSSDMIRVSAQLVDGREGLERWSQTYDRPMGDSLKIQTDIADKVADALSLQMGLDAARKLAEGGTSNAAAQDLYLHAQALAQSADSREALQHAQGVIDSAITLDPSFADAFSAKAQMLATQAGSMEDSAAKARSTYRLAEANARRAIQLAPRSRAGYSALGIILDQQLFRRDAFEQFRKMQSLPGNDSGSLLNYAVFLSEIGHSAPALKLADQAVDIDPLNPIAYGVKAYVLTNAKRYPEALAVADDIQRLALNRYGQRFRRGYLLMLMGRYAEAQKIYDDPNLEKAGAVALAQAAALAARQGNMAKSDRLLAKFAQTDGAYFQQAEVLAQQGKSEAAIAALENAYKMRDSGLTMTLVDPLLDPLRGNANFEAFFRKLDFPT